MKRLADILTVPIVLAYMIWLAVLWLARAAAMVLCAVILLPAIPMALLARTGRAVKRSVGGGGASRAQRETNAKATALAAALKANPQADPAWIARQLGV